jgi:hypothetical protein
MTYYEELGLNPGATEAEIKTSYKRLTQLLHPDQHLDPEIRALADTQMKRLNEIVSVLINSDKRANYNKTLLNESLSVLQKYPVPALLGLRVNRGWIGVGLAFVVFLVVVLLMIRGDPAARAISQAEVSKAAPRGNAAQLTENSRTIRPRGVATLASEPLERADWPAYHLPQRAKVTVPSVTSFERPKVGPGSTGLPLSLPPLLSAPALAIPTAPLDHVALPAVGTGDAENRSLAGKWVYAPDPYDVPDALVYPADYVELAVTVSAGVLRGKYKSRYKLSDRTLSPYANFTFNGPANGTTFVWLGNAGSTGEVALRLQASDTIQVNWFATKMGSQLSLGSGAATLYRLR